MVPAVTSWESDGYYQFQGPHAAAVCFINDGVAVAMKVVVIATGGTIAMKLDAVRGGVVPTISGADLLASVPAVSQIASIEVQDLSNIPSSCMDPRRWSALSEAVSAALAQQEVAGVVISHGTDTLEETAWWLDLTVQSDRPVVLTGAQRSASEADLDGPRNLLDAVRVAIAPASRERGTVVVMNGRIHAARDVGKLDTASVEGFGSGAYGILGTVDARRVTYRRAPVRRAHLTIRTLAMPRIEIVTMYGGADGALVRAAIREGARGIVIQALGAGNVNAPMYQAIREALAQGIAVVIATRVPNGGVLPHYGYEGGGATLVAAGAVMANDLPAQKARILLMLLLQHDLPSVAELQAAFDQ
jgi:L-asparaginase